MDKAPTDDFTKSQKDKIPLSENIVK